MKILKSVRFKLTFIALFTVFVITSMIVWSDVRDTKERLIAVQKEKTVLLSDIITQSIMILMIENRWKELQTLVEKMSENNPGLKETRIFHPATGRIIVSSDKSEIGTKIYEEDWKKFRAQDEAPFVIKKDAGEFASRVTSIRNEHVCHRCHSPAQNVLGGLDLEVSLEVAQRSIVASTYQHLNGLVIGFVLISLIFLVSGEKLINRPLRKLTAVMKKVQLGDLSARADGCDGDDFGYLAGAFNNMIDALESANREIEKCHLQQMERAAKLATLGEILSGIAHEIKNPLTGISCAVQVFHAEMREDDSRKTVIAEILNQVKRLDRIVKDLLTYAKPKPPHFLPAGLKDVVEKALFLVYPEAKKQNVEISAEIGADIPDIMMDTDQMQQVLLNIIINSIQAMPNGGRLDIAAQKIEKAEEGQAAGSAAGSVLITVRDTGKGIPAEDMDYIFEPFFTRKSKGTGLGLSITQGIIREHGGQISVQSEMGKGSVFAISLPVRP